MEHSPDALYSSLVADLSTITGYPIPEKPDPWMSPREYAAVSLANSFLRKYRKVNNRELDSRALAKFQASNIRCMGWELKEETLLDSMLIGEFKDSIYRFWNKAGFPIVDSFDQIFHYGMTGPGAAIRARGHSFYAKLFSSPLSLTDRGLYVAYRRYIDNYPEWSNAELIRTENYGSPTIVPGNRIAYVPKDDRASRTICVEPSLNMFAQLGFGRLLEARLKEYLGIDLEKQPDKNRELCRVGSVTEEYASIDLSDASDSISLRMLREMLPMDMYSWLASLRSKSVETSPGKHEELFMVSSMGNGFTFPLETIIFSCVVQSALKVDGFPPVHPRGTALGNWGVFGDDIICPERVFSKVIRLLKILGFRVNLDKTFDKGPFRESCGYDFYRGHNVRGVYVKTLRTQEARYAVINQLNLFSSRTGVDLPVTLAHLLKTVRFRPVPLKEDDSSGIKLPYYIARRYLHSNENGTLMYYARVPVGRTVRIMDTAVFVPRGLKSLMYNPSGLHISFLQGTINRSMIGVRHDITLYRNRRKVDPCWDYLDSTHPIAGWFNGQRWETAVELNLLG
jgi:hypothetical protein